MLIAAQRALRPDGSIGPYWLRTAGELITQSGAGPAPQVPDLQLADDQLLSPGFIDVHCHGGGGANFSAGPEAARTAIATHRAHGTTTLLASLVTDTVAALGAQIEQLRPLTDSGELAGIHLEGPWLSREYHGAHDPQLLQSPKTEDLAFLLQTGTLRMVTLAPELPGGIEAVGKLRAAGAVAALGHTAASYEQTRQALQAGAAAATHLFNAMRRFDHRAPGPVPALLEHPEAFLELIADGVHLHPAVLRSTFTQAPGRALLVSDAMAAAGAGDGHYRLGQLEVQVSGGTARILEADGTLGPVAGSTLTLQHAVQHAVQQAGVPLEQALAAVTLNPARMLGEPSIGHLGAGARADVVVLSAGLEVTAVLHGGSPVAHAGH